MIFCKNCGAQMEDGVKFCPSCGAASEAQPAAPVAAPVAQAMPVQANGTADFSQQGVAQPAAPKKSNGLVKGLIIGGVALLLVIIIVVLILVLSKTESEKFIGTWEGTIDFTEMFNKSFEEEDVDFQVEDFEIVYVWTFNEDGSYTLAADETSASEAVDAVEAEFVVFFNDYIQSVLDEYGLSNYMTVDTYCNAYMGCTVEEFAADLFDDLYETIVDGESFSGYYYAEDGKMAEDSYPLEEEDVDFELDDYWMYEWGSGDTFTLTGDTDSTSGMNEYDLYPVTFEKVD